MVIVELLGRHCRIVISLNWHILVSRSLLSTTTGHQRCWLTPRRRRSRITNAQCAIFCDAVLFTSLLCIQMISAAWYEEKMVMILCYVCREAENDIAATATLMWGCWWSRQSDIDQVISPGNNYTGCHFLFWCCEKAQLHNYAGNWRRLEEVTIDVGMVLVEIA